METHDRSKQAPTEALTWQQDDVLPGVDKPRALFLLAAGLSFLMSVYLFFSGDAERGIFVGIWVPSILSAGTLLLGRSRHE